MNGLENFLAMCDNGLFMSRSQSGQDQGSWARWELCTSELKALYVLLLLHTRSHFHNHKRLLCMHDPCFIRLEMVLKIDRLKWGCLFSGYCFAKLKGTQISYYLSLNFWGLHLSAVRTRYWKLKSISLAPSYSSLQEQEKDKPHISSYLSPVNRDLISLCH